MEASAAVCLAEVAAEDVVNGKARSPENFDSGLCPRIQQASDDI